MNWYCESGVWLVVMTYLLVTSWSAVEVEPFYPRCDGRGRPLIDLERMLHVHRPAMFGTVG